MHQVIYCTCPDLAWADKIAGHLVGSRLAACVNILPGVRSVYQWQGQVETAQEHLLLIKSPAANYNAIEAAIKSLHPYEVPEIVAVTVEQGSNEYLTWIDTCTSLH